MGKPKIKKAGDKWKVTGMHGTDMYFMDEAHAHEVYAANVRVHRKKQRR